MRLPELVLALGSFRFLVDPTTCIDVVYFIER